jgi:hypothetical protein
MLTGIVALVVVVGVLSGILFAVYSYLSPKIFIEPATQTTSISVLSTGLTSLDRWSIEGKKLNYEDLETKYLELYNYTYPFLMKEAVKGEIIPVGMPAVYGEELGVAFDANTDEMTDILRKYEDHPLDDEQMERYKNVSLRISCEYCCGVKSIIYENGKRACGCAHSYAMRGLAKYLIINHPEEYTNDEILMELGKWKATFFPKQTISKAILKYAEFGNIDPSVLTEMPNMVGSC